MAKRHVPKKKGGAVFPRIALKDAVEYAEKLVTKTHTGPKTPDILFPGVFNAKGPRGAIRASALKQYGMMEGTRSGGYRATSAAKDLVHSSGAERREKLGIAVLRPKVFAGLFDTFRGDEVSLGKVRQQAANLNVHPDNLEACAELFLSSLEYAGLAAVEGDRWLIGDREVSPDEVDRDEDRGASEGPRDDDDREGASESVANDESESPGGGDVPERGRAVIQVNVTLDSSLDTEKLQKQLELLRRYGAL